MKKFKEIKKTGDGTFGVVILAQNLQNYELVAIKKMKQKYHKFEECTNLREVKALMKLQNHPNIIKLKEVFLEVDTLCLVFEYMEKSIYQMYIGFKDQGKSMPEDTIKSIIYQCASGLSYMHKHGYFHRDLKPENMLMNSNGVLKLIDFGLAREIRSRPPYTDYVATRWYRAPEILLKQLNYNSPVDIFALGCIMAELYLNRPLFQGGSELEQFNKILSTLGTFTQQEWPEGSRLVGQLGITLAQFPSIPLSQIITNCNPDGLNLIGQMIRWDPNKRITCTQILVHPYFYNIQSILPQLVIDEQPTKLIQKEQPQQIKQHAYDPQDVDDMIDSLADSNHHLQHNKSTGKLKQEEDRGSNDFGDYIPSGHSKQHRQFSQQSQQKKDTGQQSIYNFDNVQKGTDFRNKQQQSNYQPTNTKY